MSKEIERKYLIARPAETELARHAAQRWEILQIYLRSAPGVTARIRQVTEGEETRYYYTEKRRLSSLAAEETEREVTALEYLQLFRRVDTALKPIRKCRWRIPHAGHVLEVDVYPFWERTAVLEIEFQDENESAEIPAWITILKDVTADHRYKNVSLAREVPPEEELSFPAPEARG